MLRRFDPRLLLGILLIAGGVLFLLQNFNIIPASLGWLWALVFGAVGAGFVTAFIANRDNWWALIPGLIFFDLALLIGLEAAVPGFAERWGGALFLAGLSLPFWVIYLLDHEKWWALIPGGVLTTLGVVAGLNARELGDIETGGVFFLGLGATFLIVWLAPTAQGRNRWAIWPAGALLIFGALLATPFATLAGFVLPVGLVVAGAFLLYRSFRPRAG